MLDLIIISNPRTAKGGWENEKDGCSFCGAMSCGYVGLRITINEDERVIQICGSCLLDAQKEVNKAILEQCTKRVE